MPRKVVFVVISTAFMFLVKPNDFHEAFDRCDLCNEQVNKAVMVDGSRSTYLKEPGGCKTRHPVLNE
jgi:hypothetical protein